MEAEVALEEETDTNNINQKIFLNREIFCCIKILTNNLLNDIRKISLTSDSPPNLEEIQ